jgi:sugar O-acyltransferase (sialic acid O-acetyltransferase NeuD family)
MKSNRPIIVLGGGGHAKGLIEILQGYGSVIIGCIVKEPMLEQQEILGVAVLGTDDSILLNYQTDKIYLVNGIGTVGDSRRRQRIFDDFKKIGYSFINTIHPSAIISPFASLGEGVQIMAGAIIQASSVLGDNSILNTNASIDHDCTIGKHVHVSPGAVLCGNVSVGDGSHIGAGAVVIQGIEIGSLSVIGAGSVVINDVSDSTTVYGNPARKKV